MTAVLEEPQEQVLETTAISIREEAKTLKIVDQKTYDLVAEKFSAAAQLEKTIKEHYAPLKQKAHEAHKAVCNAENEMLKPVSETKRILGQAIGEWDDEQERKRLEEQRRLEEEARKRAEEEALSTAIEVEAEGADAEEIESVLNSASSLAQRVVAPPTYTKAVSTSRRWAAEAEGSAQSSLLKLVKAAAENPAAYLGCLLPNSSEINRRAQAQKEEFNVPGYRARHSTNAVNRPAGRR